MDRWPMCSSLHQAGGVKSAVSVTAGVRGWTFRVYLGVLTLSDKTVAVD